MIKTLPVEIRICPRHGEEVSIQEASVSLNGDVIPNFKKANWVGCCEEAIDGATEGVRRIAELIDRAKQDYRDRLAVKLEPEHTGEMVAMGLETGDYFVGEDEVKAADKARLSGHAGLLFFLPVGSPYAHRLMSPRQ